MFFKEVFFGFLVVSYGKSWSLVALLPLPCGGGGEGSEGGRGIANALCLLTCTSLRLAALFYTVPWLPHLNIPLELTQISIPTPVHLREARLAHHNN